MKFLVAVLLLATVTEVVQLWVPARAFNAVYLVANVAGLAAGRSDLICEKFFRMLRERFYEDIVCEFFIS